MSANFYLAVSCSNPLDSETGAAEFFREDYSRIISGLPGNFATAGPSVYSGYISEEEEENSLKIISCFPVSSLD